MLGSSCQSVRVFGPWNTLLCLTNLGKACMPTLVQRRVASWCLERGTCIKFIYNRGDPARDKASISRRDHSYNNQRVTNTTNHKLKE